MSIRSFVRALKDQHQAMRVTLRALENMPFVSLSYRGELPDITAFEKKARKLAGQIKQLNELLSDQYEREQKMGN